MNIYANCKYCEHKKQCRWCVELDSGPLWCPLVECSYDPELDDMPEDEDKGE